MSRLSKVNKKLAKLPKSSRKAIVDLIDLKTEIDMDKVLNKLDALETKFDTKFKFVEKQFKIVHWILGLMSTAILSIIIKLFAN
jgi:mRNA-degrading endonuclease RelE of RelBE toxin-antitoxin system